MYTCTMSDKECDGNQVIFPPDGIPQGWDVARIAGQNYLIGGGTRIPIGQQPDGLLAAASAARELSFAIDTKSNKDVPIA